MKSHAIRTARVPARLSQRRVTRPTLERWLAEADPARHGLPAQAIVLVRRLQSPWTALVHPETGTRYGALASALTGAARPALGDFRGDVVWFADEAELLACLARAALAGDLALQWWWQLVLHELAPEAARARWLQAVHVAPRALTRLEETAARRWLGTWTAPEQRRLVQGLARVFPLADEAVLEEMARAETVMPAKPGSGPHCASPDEAVHATTQTSPAEGLRRLLLALARDPMAARDAHRVHALWPAVVTAAASPVAAAPSARVQASTATSAVMGDVPDPAARAPQAPGAGTAVPNESTLDASAPFVSEALFPGLKTHAAPATSAAIDAPPPAASVASADVLSTPVVPAALLRTGFGGVLFLLNAALQLGLYGDFTQPRRPRTLDCSPWRFLLASGRLYGGRAFADDALAAWLRERAPQRPPGARTRHPGLWRSLRERLQLALALDDTQDLVPALLRLPADVADAGERIDVHMDLASLPLPVRLSGLDRDPGWIPAAGCDVRFHFH